MRPAAHLLAFLLLALTPSPALSLSLTRGPYLQLGSPMSVLIVWRTDEPSNTVVEHGRDTSYGSLDMDPGLTTEHALLITDLSPGVLYHYRILGDGQVLAEGKSFRTSPDPDLPAFRFRFVALGDSGSGTEPQLQVAARLGLSDPDFGLHLGDLAYPGGTVDEYDRKYFQVYRELIARTVLYPTLGNKDVEFDQGAIYLEAFHLPELSSLPERAYSFRYGSAHLIALDSNSDLAPEGEQGRWLEEELAGSDGLWRIVFFHHPMYCSTPGVPAHRAHLEPVLNRHRVDLVLQGHQHYYERTFPIRAGADVDRAQDPDYLDPEGTIYLVTGGGGGTLARATPNAHSARYLSVYHHLELEVEDHRLSLKAIDDEGEVIDSMTLRKSPGPRPAAPSGLRASGGRERIELDWDDSSGPDLAGYHVYRAAARGGPFARRSLDLVAESRYTDPVFESGVEYCYSVAAVDTRGRKSGPSGEACAAAGEVGVLFKRGDADGDGEISVSDAIAVLRHLFLGQAEPSCPDAADGDDSGRLDISDPVYLLTYQFLGGAAPPSPGPGSCGPDLTPARPPFAACAYPDAGCR